MNSYYINNRNQKVDFANLKEPCKTRFNEVKEDAEAHGFAFIVGKQNGGTYDGKVLSYWFRNLETRETSDFFKLPKDLSKVEFSVKLAESKWM